jgi:hypothetical protein
LLFLPPDFFNPSVSDFSGSERVISAKSGYVTNRRPGEVGFGLRIGIGQPALFAAIRKKLQLRPHSAPCSPLKIGID